MKPNSMNLLYGLKWGKMIDVSLEMIDVGNEEPQLDPCKKDLGLAVLLACLELFGEYFLVADIVGLSLDQLLELGIGPVEEFEIVVARVGDLKQGPKKVLLSSK